MSADNKHPSTRLASARSREIGEELRRIRLRLGLKASAIYGEVGWSPGKLSKLEGGTRGLSEADAAMLLGFYRADKTARIHILGLVDEPDHGIFARPHHRASPDEALCARMHEAVARTLTCYQPLLLPSLLHSAAYAETLLRHTSTSRDQLHAWLDSRTARQAVLHQEPAPESVFFVHEAALRLVVGDAEVMHDQCMRLGSMADHTSIRVVPLSAGHAALRHAATLLTFTEPLKPLGYSETDTATVFFDDVTAVDTVRRKLAVLDRLALDAEQSRTVFRRWADAYDMTDLSPRTPGNGKSRSPHCGDRL
ncbi:DUF5753 domain-containing protein [Umezawaea sp. Da 62-37]|uniref:DUF5753 domain-containing protein n=1 Tax=Umezawaea sp. Da 62-37 TaxID=3075927 RepID=UPI0028F6E62B|nr:DUF5753 domain-containing protein [Umezawaea sp. Da 62-37]WNV91682.1 DUF5753 domain-containing protein [Umezawaea sp. Da 62-37]